MSHAPRITVVTPSFNQAAYLEQTLCSVLDQRYPNLEYIVIDGGSTDGSVDILHRYTNHLTYWVSEKDRGQTNAINKGMSRATGEIRAYLNSDDLYLPKSLDLIADTYLNYPEADLFYGTCRVIDDDGRNIGQRRAAISRFEEIVDLWDVWWNQRNFVQPEVFWTRRIAEQIGPLRDELNFVMDYEYWTRMLMAGAKVQAIERELACFRITSTQKSNSRDDCAREILSVVRGYLWNDEAPITSGLRWRLQGSWLYQTKFLAEVSASVSRGESQRQRMIRLAGVIGQHPKILLSPSLKIRARSILNARSIR